MGRCYLVMFMALGMLALAGCEKDSGNSGQVELSGNDVARALGMNAWEVTLPADHDKDATVGLKLKYPDGSVKRLSGVGSVSPGTVCKIVVWRSDDKLKCALLTDRHSTRSDGMEMQEIVGDFRGAMLFEAERKLGDMLMKWGNDKVLSSSTVNEGEVALIFDVWE
ncbi:hypothetical protein STSP2_00180 [Anaerohalosphaera lusitana]|uniref:DUF306 domain-containing protein n=1 Tax=Anaerohalosphaera lusitana TaxID=1936003 RepID=A0A1U9NGH2_9BACT|nr:hypothetical protein [Anaerohalosphaera lusitana]AQT67041.1 hypothetical protein STSP2_00180 [Anaerohalosphaera lusitana]